jgi:hypothetical protein
MPAQSILDPKLRAPEVAGSKRNVSQNSQCLPKCYQMQKKNYLGYLQTVDEMNRVGFEPTPLS